MSFAHIVVCVILADAAIAAAWINISQHAMNSAYALFEITLTNAGPSPWLHLPLCVFMLACYLGVAYITHATQGFYSTYLSSRTSTRVTLRGHCTRLLHTLTPGISLRPQRTRS